MKVKEWIEKNIPKQSGKTIIITGANTGLGFEATKILSSKGATVIMGCRSIEKAEKAKKLILEENNSASLDIIQIDLADLSSVRNFAEKVKEKYEVIDILLNNAGVMMVPYSKTKDGFEMHLGVNHFGHFALTGLLLPNILAAKNSRIVTMSSMMHRYGTMDFTNLMWEKGYKKSSAYGRSKLANLLFAYELDRKLREFKKETISLASHPGWSRTDLQRHTGALRSLNPVFGMRPEKGVLPMVYAATNPNVDGGEYYGPGGFMEMKGFPKKVESNQKSKNIEDAKKLWEISEKLTKVKYEFE